MLIEIAVMKKMIDIDRKYVWKWMASACALSWIPKVSWEKVSYAENHKLFNFPPLLLQNHETPRYPPQLLICTPGFRLGY